MSKICLVLIVKDEERVIDRCLQALLPYVDSWCIVDTGSSDRTMEIIQEAMKGVPGELHERPWVSFQHNRSELMALARERGLAGDFMLMIDADDTWTPEADFRWPDLEQADAWAVQLTLGRLGHYRTQLTRSSQPWCYSGAAHESLVGPRGHRKERLRGVSIRCGDDGARRVNEPIEKYRRVARQLEEELAKDPDDGRSLFYCAQSHRDAGDLPRAIELYQRRVTLPGEEEAWYSLFQIAELKFRLKHPWAEVEEAYLAAFERRPTRAEPLLAIAEHYRKERRWPMAYLFACAANTIPRPTDNLFVYEGVYAWEALDEFAFDSAHVGRLPEAAAATRRLLASPGLPRRERERVRGNLERSEVPLAPGRVVHGERVTVSMATHGCIGCQSIREAVRSVLEQTYANLILVVVSDGDEKPPWDGLKEFEDDPRLILVESPTNQGPYFCHELVRRASPDRIFTVQDDDDLSHPERLDTLVRRMERDNADAVFCALTHTGGSEERVVPPSPGVLAAEPLAAFVHVGSHVALMRSEAVAAVGGYYAGFRFGYDTLLGLAISRLGRPSFVQDALYYYSQRPTSLTKQAGTGHGSRKRRRAINQMIDLWSRAVSHGDPARELRETIAQRLDPRASQELTLMSSAIAASLPPPAGILCVGELFPEPAPEAPVLTFEQLVDLRGRYVNEVSHRDDMAISVETGALLVELVARVPGLTKILDLGTGFSSAVLRALPGDVTSVDHDPDWLARSRDFVVDLLIDQPLGERWWTGDEFAVHAEPPYDLIVHDLSARGRSAQGLDGIWETLRPGGLLLLDDMHKAPWRAEVDAFLATQPHRRFDVRTRTSDGFGRFVYLVQRTEVGS